MTVDVDGKRVTLDRVGGTRNVGMYLSGAGNACDASLFPSPVMAFFQLQAKTVVKHVVDPALQPWVEK